MCSPAAERQPAAAAAEQQQLSSRQLLAWLVCGFPPGRHDAAAAVLPPAFGTARSEVQPRLLLPLMSGTDSFLVAAQLRASGGNLSLPALRGQRGVGAAQCSADVRCCTARRLLGGPVPLTLYPSPF